MVRLPRAARTTLVSALTLALAAAARPARAAEAGEVVQADNLGFPLYTYNFDTKTGTSIGQKVFVSEFMGAHYFVTDTVRVGMMIQFTEQFAGDLAPGADRFSTFALLPQVGWNFYDHFSAAAIFTYAPRAAGKARYDLGVQALLGYAIPLRDGVAFAAALEVPVNFRLATTLGFTPLVGFSYRL